jgi:hypothetical protein
MKKTLSERIAERAKGKMQSRNAKNRAQFINARDEIEEALGDNWTVKDIWNTLHSEGVITFSYEAFRKYVNAWRSTKEKEKDTRPENTQSNTEQKPKEPVIAENNPIKDTPKKGFFINNSPNKEDLI